MFGRVFITHQSRPSTTLNGVAIKREEEVKRRLLPGGAADVICHLQLMKVMMTCMSGAYVRHLLRSSTLELRESEARLREGSSASVGVPRRSSR